MGFQYQTKFPDKNGFIHYSEIENETWEKLLSRQLQTVQGRACEEFLTGIKTLHFPRNKVPQVLDIDKVLRKKTGWKTEVVPCVIPAEKFFNLLANKKFPVATFIRIPEEFDYLEEPDIFHELFGHCPLLTHPAYANYMQAYGELALQTQDKKIRNRLFRLFWFTIEFGLLKRKNDFFIYGGGILSSHKETIHSLENKDVKREPLDVLKAMRTPFRIDIVQPLYYYIESLESLFDILELDLLSLAQEAVELGNLAPLFPPKDEYAGDGYQGDEENEPTGC